MNSCNKYVIETCKYCTYSSKESLHDSSCSWFCPQTLLVFVLYVKFVGWSLRYDDCNKYLINITE